jgi:hypothetical protein
MISAINTSSRPPENATGKYVKIVQRVPVRIRFNPNQRNLDKLRPGMSVEPRVHPTLFHLRMAFWTEGSAAREAKAPWKTSQLTSSASCAVKLLRRFSS